jgi:hypothetical protein
MSNEPQIDTLEESVRALVIQLRGADDDVIERVKSELITMCDDTHRTSIRDVLTSLKRGELLEVQWEIEEVLEATEPVVAEPEPDPEPEPETEDAPEDPNRPLTASDLVAVYDDPSSGIMLHRTKTGDRWFLTQVDPMSGQPRTMPLHPEDVQQIKAQLEGSPYWILGA